VLKTVLQRARYLGPQGSQSALRGPSKRTKPYESVATLAPVRHLVFLILVAVSLLPAAPASARKMEIAIQDDGVFLSRPRYPLDRAYRQALQLKVSRIRANVSWAYISPRPHSRRRPSKINYNFYGADQLVNAAAARGIKVQLALTGPVPAWAAGNHRLGPYRPNARLFAQFVRDAALHFKGRVDRYSIWNEPNHVGWLAPLRRQATLYRSLYLSGWRAIKAVDRNAQVLIGETAPYPRGNNSQPPLKFLRQITCTNKRYRPIRRCPRIFADGFAHHPYDFDHAPTYRYPGKDNVTIGTLGRLTKALDKLRRSRRLSTSRGGRLDLYLTEYGYFGSGKRRVSQSRRAAYLVRAFRIALANGRVRQMLQYLLVQPDRSHRFFDTSIVSPHGGETLPFRRLASWASRAARGHRIVLPVPPPKTP